VREEQDLARALEKAKEKELNLWRAFTEHGLRAEHYAKLAKEYQEEQQRITVALLAIKEHNKDHITNLDTALTILTQIGERYRQQNPNRQRQILQHMVWKVVVNEEGCVLRLDFKPPFAYLHKWVNSKQDGDSSGLAKQNHQNTANSGGNRCSLYDSFGSPNGVRTRVFTLKG
jgi:hypothetical protein